jgi:hypothetical protein
MKKKAFHKTAGITGIMTNTTAIGATTKDNGAISTTKTDHEMATR